MTYRSNVNDTDVSRAVVPNYKQLPTPLDDKMTQRGDYLLDICTAFRHSEAVACGSILEIVTCARRAMNPRYVLSDKYLHEQASSCGAAIFPGPVDTALNPRLNSGWRPFRRPAYRGLAKGKSRAVPSTSGKKRRCREAREVWNCVAHLNVS